MSDVKGPINGTSLHGAGREKSFVLFRKGTRVCASMLELGEENSVLEYQGRKYQRLSECLGDFDHLIAPDGRLIGFSFLYYDLFSESLQNSRLIRETTNTAIASDVLSIVLVESPSYVSDEWQVVGNEILGDTENDHLIILPVVSEWSDTEKLGFVLEDQDRPVLEC